MKDEGNAPKCPVNANHRKTNEWSLDEHVAPSLARQRGTTKIPLMRTACIPHGEPWEAPPHANRQNALYASNARLAPVQRKDQHCDKDSNIACASVGLTSLAIEGLSGIANHTDGSI